MTHTKTNYFSIKNIWKIAYPIILGNLAQDIITVVDTAFIGRLGEIELGGAAIGSIFYLAIVMIGWGFGLGIQILIARRYGEKNFLAINPILFHAFIMLLALASLVFGLVYFFDTQIFDTLVQSSAVANESQKFIHIRIFGIFAAFVNINFRAFYIGTSNTKILIITTALMALINIALDYVLIFGIGIFPRMDIEGAALASVIAEYVALIYFVFYTLGHKKNQPFHLFKFEKLNARLSRQIFNIATPTLIQNSLSFSSWFFFFLFVEKMGETQLAISNIIRSIYIILLVPIFGFASATNTLVSYSIGNKTPENIWPIIKRSLAMALAGMLALVLLGILFPRQIIRVYTSIESIIDATVPVFYVIMLSSFAIAFGFILFQAVSGTGKTMVSLCIEIIVLVFYLSGVYILSVSDAPSIAWVWTLEIFYGLGLGILAYIYLKNPNWYLKKI